MSYRQLIIFLTIPLYVISFLNGYLRADISQVKADQWVANLHALASSQARLSTATFDLENGGDGVEQATRSKRPYLDLYLPLGGSQCNLLDCSKLMIVSII